MISKMLIFLVDRVTDVLTHMVRSVLWCSFFFSVAYSLGWVQRFLWFALEQTATTLWNGTPVTIGSLEIDLIRGRLWATNVVIHTPKRDEWQWESPLICRIGRVYIEHNWISSFLAMLSKMAWQGQKQILELYTVEVSDIQGFIERKQHIFNFYLLDPWIDLPDPKEILEEEKDLRMRQTQNGATRQSQPGQAQPLQSNNNAEEPKNTNNGDNLSEASVDLSITQDHVEAAFPANNPNRNNQSTASFFVDTEKDDLLDGEDDNMAHRQAQQLVDDMFSAVKSIGRATRKKGALDKGTIAKKIASKLKEFQGTKNKSEVMKEGVKVVRQVSQAVAKKTKDMKTVMPKVPNRREPDIAPVYARVGRVIIQDARVFTRTTTTGSTASTAGTTVPGSTNGSGKLPPMPNRNTKKPASTGNVGTNSGEQSDPPGDKSDSTAMATNGLGAKWNKPIGISEIVLRPSELCPPNSLLDENGLPAVFQPIDKIVDVVLKRCLVGLAKSNTTRFLQTAMGELLEMEYSSLFGENGGMNSDRSVNGRPYQRSETAMSEPV